MLSVAKLESRDPSREMAKQGIKRRSDAVTDSNTHVEKQNKKRKDSRDCSGSEGENSPTSKSLPIEPIFQHERLPLNLRIPQIQERLLLHGKRQPYRLDHSYQVPQPNGKDEVLVKIQYIGLNPIDWKAPDFGFGIPWLPYIAGREFVGQVLAAPPEYGAAERPLKVGDIVFSASTDYRDRRKAAFQQLVVAPIHNVCRVPRYIGQKSCVAGLAVAFVASTLSMGVCLGVDFGKSIGGGPNLKGILSSVPTGSIPKDVRTESLRTIVDGESPKKGDWLAIWGGSSTTASVTAQLAKLIGMRVIKIVDVAKHGARLCEGPADLIVDAYDPKRAVEIVRRVTGGRLRFGVDTVGATTADLLRRTLQSDGQESNSHLVGLTGLPKPPPGGVQLHTVPIKLHHEIPQIGEAMMLWLEDLLATGKLVPPEVEVLEGGLSVVNKGLDRMRQGEISGRRLAVCLE